jgi:hypothetical protein
MAMIERSVTIDEIMEQVMFDIDSDNNGNNEEQLQKNIKLFHNAVEHCIKSNFRIERTDTESYTHILFVPNDGSITEEQDFPKITYYHKPPDPDDIESINEHIENLQQTANLTESQEINMENIKGDLNSEVIEDINVVIISWINSNKLYPGYGLLLLIIFLFEMIILKPKIILQLDNDTGIEEYYNITLKTCKVVDSDGESNGPEEMAIYYNNRSYIFQLIKDNLLRLRSKKSTLTKCIQQYLLLKKESKDNIETFNPVILPVILRRSARLQEQVTKQSALAIDNPFEIPLDDHSARLQEQVTQQSASPIENHLDIPIQFDTHNKDTHNKVKLNHSHKNRSSARLQSKKHRQEYYSNPKDKYSKKKGGKKKKQSTKKNSRISKRRQQRRTKSCYSYRKNRGKNKRNKSHRIRR